MKFIKTAIAASILGLVTSANAATIAFDNTSTEAGSGLSYSQTFNIVGNYSLVSLFVETHDDYYSNSNEWIKFSLDGNQILQWDGGQIYGAPSIAGSGSNKTLSGTVAISESLWNTIAADNQVTVSWQQGPSTNSFSNSPEYVNWSLTGNVSAVPEPSTVAMMIGGLGLVGLMAARRKKQA